MKKITIIAMLAAFCIALCSSLAMAAVPEVPVDVYKWVQSSSRTNYYFNRQQIHFGRKADGMPDLDILQVPVLKTYDDIHIHDIVSKRRWKGKPVDILEDLVGNSEYLEINLKTRVVTVKQVDLLDSTLTTIETTMPNQQVELDKLSDKSLERKFYNSIIDYAKRNELKLALRVNSKLSQEERDRIMDLQNVYRALHRAAKPEDNEEL